MEDIRLRTDSIPASFSPYPSDSSSDRIELREEQEDGPVPITDYSNNAAVAVLNDDESTVIRDDTWSCILALVTFWLFVSMTLILGVYGSANVTLGPNCSLLLQPNPYFVRNVKVKELDNSKPGLMLYGFYKTPTLDIVTAWDEAYHTSVQQYSHKEWLYYLNTGAEITVAYNVQSAYSVYLVIAQGNEGLNQWLQDPTYPNTTMSWNLVNGNGLIRQNIYLPSNYYVALGNMNSDAVEVQLNISIRALEYNTTGAYYSCPLSSRDCTLQLYFPNGNEGLLTSPGPDQGTTSEEQQWVVRLSYGPRWITYIAGVGAMTLVMLLAFNLLSKFQYMRESRSGVRFGEMASSRAPLLTRKDDDLMSWGSSYDCLSNGDEDLEDCPRTSTLKGKLSADDENLTVTHRLCAICYDAPRDCFFLPCSHCVACYGCAMRILEAGGTCPVCEKTMKKTIMVMDRTRKCLRRFKVAEAYDCKIMEGVLSHVLMMRNLKRIVYATPSVMKYLPVWVDDTVIKPKLLDEKQTSILKRAVDKNYHLKMKASGYIFSDINEKRARLGLLECVNHDLLQPYPVLHKKPGDFVARIKFTLLLMPSGSDRITSHPSHELQPTKTIDE